MSVLTLYSELAYEFVPASNDEFLEIDAVLNEL